MADPERPKPSWDPPPGTRLVAQVDPGWRLVDPAVGPAPCRFGAGPGSFACGKPSVAALRRGTLRPVWWAYCADHMYGRWIEDGKVMHWRAVSNEEGR